MKIAVGIRTYSEQPVNNDNTRVCVSKRAQNGIFMFTHVLVFSSRRPP